LDCACVGKLVTPAGAAGRAASAFAFARWFATRYGNSIGRPHR